MNLPGASCVVAETSGVVVGFILGESDGKRGHVITIDVLEHARRRGIGTALLDTLERSLATHGVREVALETATANDAAVAFWKRHGYRTVGVLKRYYSGRSDAYSMQKLLIVPKET
jgi:ribosomal protein S18 acetylase RimI-like enzyme